MRLPWKLRSKLILIVQMAGVEETNAAIAERWSEAHPEFPATESYVGQMRHQYVTGRRPGDPTEDEIAQACRRIRADRGHWVDHLSLAGFLIFATLAG